MEFTPQELSILTRIVGNHITGEPGVVDKLYDKLVTSCVDRGPFPKTCRHPYGDRPMIDTSEVK